MKCIQLLLVAFLLLNTVTVNGSYNLSIAIHSYTNPDNHCVSCRDDGIGCCDNFEGRRCRTPGSRSRCETYFQYCLLPLNTVANNGPVSCTVLAQSNPGVDDSSINFMQSTVLGLSNPLVLHQPSSAWMGIQLQIIAIDDDTSGSDDLIDFFQLNINSGSITGTSINLNGRNNIAQMSLSYLVDLDNCIGIDCSGRGRCVDGQNSYTCICDSGFTGVNCDTNADDCLGVSCSGRGTCIDGVNAFTCSCDVGFTGASCQTNIDDCIGRDCSGHGQCVDGINSYTCTCDTGFTGTNCGQAIDDCAGVDCSGNGLCVDRVNGFTCFCNPGFSGTQCQTNIDDCIGVFCSGNGECLDGVNSFTCRCSDGFMGRFCQVNIDDCVGVDCSGNGRCVDGVNSSMCVCDAEYRGDNCQFLVCSSTNCSDLVVDDGDSDGLDFITLVVIIGGSLGGFIVLFILIAVILAVAVSTSCRSSTPTRTKPENAPPSKTMRNVSLDLTDNIGYGKSFADDIYEEIPDRASCCTGVAGSRRHGVYGGAINDIEPYSVYDVVL